MHLSETIACWALAASIGGCATTSTGGGPGALSPAEPERAASPLFIPEAARQRVHVRLDPPDARDEGVELHELSSTTWVAHQSGGAYLSRSYETLEWVGHPLCSAPCDRDVSNLAGYPFRFDGPWILPSVPFSLTGEPGELWFTVKPGSVVKKRLGTAAFVLGALGAGFGLIYTAVAVSNGDVNRHDIAVTAAVLDGTSAALLTGGITFMLTTETTFSLKVQPLSPGPPSARHDP